MVSKFQKKTSTEDLKLVGIFESNLVNIEQLACGDQTKKEWCRIVRRTYQKHLCLYCKDKADSSSTSGEQNNVEKSCPDSPLTNAYDERSDDHKRISLSSGFSSIPDWVQSTRYEPYHFIQIGIAKTKKELPSSKVCKEEFDIKLDIGSFSLEGGCSWNGTHMVVIINHFHCHEILRFVDQRSTMAQVSRICNGVQNPSLISNLSKSSQRKSPLSVSLKTQQHPRAYPISSSWGLKKSGMTLIGSELRPLKVMSSVSTACMLAMDNSVLNSGRTTICDAYNVAAHDPFSFQHKSLDTVQKEWTEWKKNNHSLYLDPIVGTVASFLLKKVGSLVGKRILSELRNLIFPSGSTNLMQDILRETEKFLNQRLNTDTLARVNAELTGLQANVEEFNRQVDNFLNPNRNAVPLSITSSVNTMQQLFLNRLPQFQMQGYQLLLLPLFAQAANLHLSFIRDVILNADEWGISAATLRTYRDYLKNYTRDYSNYCINTYQSAFKGLNTRLHDMLEFRTYMFLNVFEYVSIWSLFKYQSLLVSSGANLYASGSGPQQTQSFTSQDWPFLYSLFQVNSNYVLNGFSGARLSNTFPNIVGLPGSTTTHALLAARVNYSGGISSGDIGASPFNQNFNCSTFLPPLLTPFVRSWLDSGSDREGVATVTNWQTESFETTLGLRSGAFTARGNSNYFPDYFIRNISGVPLVVRNEDLRRPLHYNEIRNIASPSGTPGGARAYMVSVHNRKNNIHAVHENGSMIHLAPNDYTGFTISPIHATQVNNQTRTFISEKFGNQGDSLRFEQNNTTARYTLRGNGNSYNLYLRVSSIGNSTIRVTINGRVYTATNVNTTTNNDGVNDNGARFSDINIGNVVASSNSDVPLDINVTLNSGTQFDLMNIMLVPTNISPLY